ncbi:MAG TPA: TRAP transporter substrate-binding protein [Burkholderiales bacterium]|nr:TRAP transporter substrate-binding protein [Burkholderiales bacterium]
MKALLKSCMALALLVGAGAGHAQTKWDLASGYPINNPHTITLNEFASDVDKTTGGKLMITVHPGGSLLKVPEIKRGVQSGQVQVGEVLMSVLENENALYGIDSVPFLATSFDSSYELWQAQRPAVEKLLAGQGVKLLYAVAWPPQGIFSKKPINSTDDFKGLKWRSYNATTQRIAQEYGAQPVTIQASELAQALATGGIEAFMTSSATGVDAKVWESVSLFYTVDAWLPKNMVIMNQKEFDKLDKSTQQTVLKAAKEVESKGWKRMRDYTQQALSVLKQNKINVAAPSDKLRAGLDKFGEQSLADWLVKVGDDGKAVLGAYKKK